MSSRLACPLCDCALAYAQTVSESGFLRVQGPFILQEWHDTETLSGLTISCETKDCKFKLADFPDIEKRITLNLG